MNGATVAFDLLTVHERRVRNMRLIGERCGWPELDQLVRLLREQPGWTAHYSLHGVAPYADHKGRTEPGIPAGCWVAHRVGDVGTGAPRVIAECVDELRTALMTEPS